MHKWLTPDEPPERKFYTRRLVIPAAFDWLALFNGCLVELTKPWNYEEQGTLTPDETAEIMSGIYEQYLAFDNEPPDWETPDDLDGLPEQPWYESLSDWIIQGFLAITFTPEAAIVYQATVPKLRIAIRTGNLGALFRVLINGVEVWTGDSYAPITDLIDHVFDMSAETEPYTVRIEHNGVGEGHGLVEAKLEVVRGEAVASMVSTILRADPTGCGVQWSEDNGDNWETIDLSECINSIANGAIGQAIDDGLLQRAGGQPSPSAPPDTGACVTHHVKLSGNDVWLCPSPVSSWDTITVTNGSGGWGDGIIVDAWACPDGTQYALGTCGSENDTVTEDPLNTAPHMCLIGKVVSTYFDAFRDGYTVPPGVVDQPFILQANDSLLSDNLGSIEFDVEVCSNNAPAGCYEFDFTADDGGFSVYHYPGLGWGAGEYITDEGWQGTFYVDSYYLTILSDVALGEFSWDSAEVDFYNPSESNVDVNLNIHTQDEALKTVTVTAIPGNSTVDIDWGGSTWGATKRLWWNWGSGGSTQVRMRKLRFIGCDTAPAGTVPCA